MEAIPVKSSIEPTRTYHFWSFDDLGAATIFHFTSDGVRLDLDQAMAAPLFKLGLFGNQVIVRKTDTIYRLKVPDPPLDPSLAYPHGGSPVLLYRDGRTGFCEAELSGPLKKLGPGEKTTFTFSIDLEAP